MTTIYDLAHEDSSVMRIQNSLWIGRNKITPSTVLNIVDIKKEITHFETVHISNFLEAITAHQTINDLKIIIKLLS